jgi:hypothetical protein
MKILNKYILFLFSCLLFASFTFGQEETIQKKINLDSAFIAEDYLNQKLKIYVHKNNNVTNSLKGNFNDIDTTRLKRLLSGKQINSNPNKSDLDNMPILNSTNVHDSKMVYNPLNNKFDYGYIYNMPNPFYTLNNKCNIN